MSAAEVLRVARAAGVHVQIDGDDLSLEASAAPPPAVIDLLTHHKAEIAALLRQAEDGWSHEEDRQVLFDERAGIIEYDGSAPRAWAEALAQLEPTRPPCDIPSKRWLQFIDDCGQFIDDGWANCAQRLGWSPLELFGCDSTKPFARVNRAGLLWLLSGRRLVALAGDAAGIATASGGYLTIRRSMCEPGGVLAWELSREVDAQ